MAYLLAPAVAVLLTLAAPLLGGHDLYAEFDQVTWQGLLRSAVFAWLVVRLSGLLRRLGLRVQL